MQAFQRMAAVVAIAFITVIGDRGSDVEKIYNVLCQQNDGWLVKIGRDYYCDYGPDPTPFLETTYQHTGGKICLELPKKKR
jgi:hypothetical protein